jgi:hypothetical protein
MNGLDCAPCLPLRGDDMIQIGSQPHRQVDKYVFVRRCAPVPSARPQLRHRGGHAARVRQDVPELDPDIVTGYNIMGFDFQYIYRRAQELSKLLAADLELGRIRPERPATACSSASAASALGDNDLSYLSMPGRLLFDTMNQKGPQARQLHAQPAVSATGRHHAGDIFRLHAGDDDDRAVAVLLQRLRPLQPALREAVRRDGRVRHGGGLQVPTT